MARTYLRQVEAAVRDWIINHEPRRTTGSNNAGGRQVHFALAPFHLRLPQAIQFISDDRGARFCRDQWHMLRLEDRPNTCAVAAIRSLMPQQEVFKAIADPTLHAILRRLQRGSLRTGEIEEAFDVAAASLSQ